jgi:hypothetical protein
MDEITDGEGFNLVGAESGSQSSGVFYALLKNPVLGDNLISLDRITEGNLSLVLNPSMTFQSLEKIYPGIVFYEYGRYASRESSLNLALGRFLKEMPFDLIKKFPNFRGNPDLELNVEEMCFGDLILLAMRLEVEIRLGRSTLNQYVKSQNKWISWFGGFWSSEADPAREDFASKNKLGEVNKRALNSLASIHWG